MSLGVDVFEDRYEDWAKQVGELADNLEKQKISNGKVGLVGFSNGGILATGASTLDSKITAAVIYYGTEPWPLNAEPKRFPPLLILHGDADQVIPASSSARPLISSSIPVRRTVSAPTRPRRMAPTL